MHNLNFNGVTGEDGFINFASVPGVTLERRVTGTAAAGSGRYSFLNRQAGCNGLQLQAIDPTVPSSAPLAGVSELNYQAKYVMLQPEIKRAGLSTRFTANIGDNAQVYVMGNYYKTDTFASFQPLGLNGSLPPPNNPNAAPPANVILPTYICDTGHGTFNGLNTGCTAVNGTLNPNNAYAAQGDRAQALLRSWQPRTVDTSSRAMRGVVGIEGSFADSWNYSGSFTASTVDMTLNQGGYIIPQRVWDVAATGAFNFVNPDDNSPEVWDYIAPNNKTDSKSQLWQLQGTISKDIMDLAGGALQAAFGLSYREESIDQPSANSENTSTPYNRYYSINAVGTSGERTVKSAFFEVDAPVLKQLELTASGRFDDYSSGQSNFSPKLGFKFTPIEMLAFRGTWSEGFRIPSFNEAYGLPTTGYVTRAVDCGAAANATWCSQHPGATAGTFNSYATGNYSLGLTTTGTPDLDPEESTSFTAGIVFEPMSNLSLTLDYWQIEVKNLIVGISNSGPIEDAYYANNGVVNIPGYSVVQGLPDPANPLATPVLGFIQSNFSNKNKENVSGIDFAANLSLPIGDAVTWRSSIDVSYLQEFQLVDEGVKYNYEGTLSPCNITSCSGAPQYRGSWQNSVEFAGTTVSLTAYYTSGYDTASLDFGGVEGQCQDNADAGTSTAAYVDGSPVNCSQAAQWNADLTARHTFNDKYTVYLDVLNVFDIEPEFDPSAAYGLFGYNPAWGGPNIMGRYYRVGVKFDF